MKDQPAKVTFHKRATVALDALPLEEKNTVLKAINYLSFFEIESAIGENVKKFNIDKPLYLLRVNPSIRVIFRFNYPDNLEILDLVMKERLELFAANKS